MFESVNKPIHSASDCDLKDLMIDRTLIPNCIKLSSNIHKGLQELNGIEDQTNKEFFDKTWKIVGQSEKLTQQIRSIPIEYGQNDAYNILKEHLSGADDSSCRIDFFQLEKNAIKIVLPELAPRRFNPRKHDEHFLENLDYIRSSYMEQFKKFFNEKRIFYRGRVVIQYKNYFESPDRIIDDDNFNYKLLTDMIAEYILHDDNPKCCMKVFDYGIAKFNHTEIMIFPITEWTRYIEMPFNQHDVKAINNSSYYGLDVVFLFRKNSVYYCQFAPT